MAETLSRALNRIYANPEVKAQAKIELCRSLQANLTHYQQLARQADSRGESCTIYHLWVQIIEKQIADLGELSVAELTNVNFQPKPRQCT